MYAAPGPATNATSAATSSTVPYRLSAVFATCGVAQSPAAGFRSVSIGPGCTLFTVIPRLPTSLDNPWVNILTAPFVAEYGTSPGVWTRSPTAEPMLMMRPPSFMCFRAACVVANTPRMLMASIRSISSSVVSSNVFGLAVPALFTSTSSRPKVAAALSTAPLAALASAASAWIATAFPPLSSIALTTAEAAAASLAYVMATLAPSAASRFAIAAPIPREPPVTSAIFPSRFLDMLLPSVSVLVFRDLLSTLSVRTRSRNPESGDLELPPSCDGKLWNAQLTRGVVVPTQDSESAQCVPAACPADTCLQFQSNMFGMKEVERPAPVLVA